MKKVIGILFVASLAACASKPPVPQYLKGPDQPYNTPTTFPERQGMVVFYRQGGLEGKTPAVFANDRIVGSLLPNHYAQSNVCAGTVAMRADVRGDNNSTGRTLSLTVMPSQVAYLRIDETPKGFTMLQVQPEAATKQLEEMSPSHIVNRNHEDCPAPPPVIEVAPAPAPVIKSEPITRQVNLKGDALFTFGRSGRNDISTAGINQLDQLIADIKSQKQGLKVERIRIVGHTDRLGKAEANKRLSLARADTVAEYFRSQGLFMPIETVGRGSEDPVTANCKGNKRSPKLVACLQPDRRVTIDLIGLVVDKAP